MGTRDAGSMRKQDQICSFSCFVLCYPESQTILEWASIPKWQSPHLS